MHECLQVRAVLAQVYPPAPPPPPGSSGTVLDPAGAARGPTEIVEASDIDLKSSSTSASEASSSILSSSATRTALSSDAGSASSADGFNVAPSTQVRIAGVLYPVLLELVALCQPFSPSSVRLTNRVSSLLVDQLGSCANSELLKALRQFKGGNAPVGLMFDERAFDVLGDYFGLSRRGCVVVCTIMEYLVTELVELAGNCADEDGDTEILPVRF